MAHSFVYWTQQLVERDLLAPDARLLALTNSLHESLLRQCGMVLASKAALEAYVRGGGRLMYLGGNGFYWRIAHHPTRPGVIEVRRAEGGVRAWAAEPGEYHHSFTGEYGGLWRRNGRATLTTDDF